jgi:hypothetical protein
MRVSEGSFGDFFFSYLSISAFNSILNPVILSTIELSLKMLYPLSILGLLLLALIHLTHGQSHRHTHPVQTSQHSLSQDTIPFETRVYWMRRANAALVELESPCPFGAFGSVVVNHTDTSSDPKGKLVCMSVNQSMQKGNPTLHGNYNSNAIWETANER